MSRTFILALGIFLTIASSITGLVIIPNWQFKALQPIVKLDGTRYPEPYFGEQAKGREIYINQGCIYCHTQQVRMKGYGADIRRGWGTRRSVPRDYLMDRPHQLGTMRTGPDLASIGARQPSAEWHALHLYNPQITSPGSVMPRFEYFFREVYDGEVIPNDAVKIPRGRQASNATHIVPTDRGRAVIAYLKRLNQSYPLPEANQ
ncbi:MAG: cbb3-type cytochrome c oxidase subunit II [Bryobacteraceae bacterium]|nr:cbb3-type cytochrome c oxidase subunit II [Bryobacteraceae bacterium]